MKACINSRDYGAARHVEAQLQQLKQQQERHALEALAAQQADERASNEAVFTQARQELTCRWQERMAQMQDQLMLSQQQLMAKHEEETTDLLAAQMSTQARPRFTPQLLNMRRVERNLAEQRNFTKANKVKQQADQQELLELQCWDAEKLSKWELERAALSAQHAREQAAADKKVASVLMEAQLLQQQEVEQLTRRFQAAQLAMSRTHAAQQLKAATALRGTLGLPKPSSLMSLPSFNTSLMPPRYLIQPPPNNPAETCRPAHLFEETLQPAPCHAGLQPAASLIPTLLAHNPKSPSQAHQAPASLSYGSFKTGPMSCSGSSGSFGGRGPSPVRRSPGPCTPTTPRSRAAAAADCVHAWAGGSILSSGAGNPLARAAPSQHQHNPLAGQALAAGGGSSPARGGQTAATRQQPPHAPSFSNSSRGSSPARSIRSHHQPVSPPSVPASPLCPPGSSGSMGSGRAPSPARMPHPPCQPSSNSRPCSPAVNVRRGGAAAAGSPQGMVPSNARFASPSKSRHGAQQAAAAVCGAAAQQPASRPESPYVSPNKAVPPASRQQQQHVHQAAGPAGAAQPAAVVSHSAARLSNGMEPGTSCLQVGPPMEAPVAVAAPLVELSAEEQQWLGEKVQRLQSLANHLECGDAEEDGLLPPGTVPQFPLARVASAEGQAEGGDEPPADASSSPVAAQEEAGVGEAQGSDSEETTAQAPAAAAPGADEGLSAGEEQEQQAVAD